MFSSRHTSALSIQPSEFCGSNFCRTCLARADNSLSLSRSAVHVFSPMQITLSIVSIVFRLMKSYPFLPYLIYGRGRVLYLCRVPGFRGEAINTASLVPYPVRPVFHHTVSLCGRFPAAGLCFGPQYSPIRAGHTVLLSPVTHRPPAVGFVAPITGLLLPAVSPRLPACTKYANIARKIFFRTVCVLSCPCRDAGWRCDGRFDQ